MTGIPSTTIWSSASKSGGCNHCTGLITAQKFVDAGYPVVKGTARFRSKTTNYLGNGDVIKFPT